MNVKCDICSSEYAEPLYNISDYTIYKCNKCGLIYTDIKPSNINNAYEIDYYKKVYPDYESDINTHYLNNTLILQKIEQNFNIGSLVEIGSAFGFFLKCARERNWKTLGFETSKYASMIARQKYNNNVLNSDFLSYHFENNVDIVVMLDTIEHLLNPSLFIKKCAEIIKPHGGIILTTGDINSFFARMFFKKWRMIQPPLHIYYYSPKTITSLLEKHGFSIISITHPGKYQNINSIIQYLFGIKKNKFAKIPIKVNVGDIMMVVAKKF